MMSSPGSASHPVVTIVEGQVRSKGGTSSFPDGPHRTVQSLCFLLRNQMKTRWNV